MNSTWIELWLLIDHMTVYRLLDYLANMVWNLISGCKMGELVNVDLKGISEVANNLIDKVYSATGH